MGTVKKKSLTSKLLSSKHILSKGKNMTNPKVLSKEDIKEFRSNFESNDKNLFAQNVVHEHGPSKACLNPKAKLAISDNVFSHTIGDFFSGTNQGSSGRCWIFAGLNAMRIPLKKSKNISEWTDFEFSQTKHVQAYSMSYYTLFNEKTIKKLSC